MSLFCESGEVGLVFLELGFDLCVLLLDLFKFLGLGSQLVGLADEVLVFSQFLELQLMNLLLLLQLGLLLESDLLLDGLLSLLSLLSVLLGFSQNLVLLFRLLLGLLLLLGDLDEHLFLCLDFRFNICELSLVLGDLLVGFGGG